ncbi:PX domain-containing protein EREL1 isoform X2 [Nymphaea colorata]|uniref:PX domain-containing protein EREL1 isoform X2 n=1 Tax=Nymphaea colorata TaxID=210225 RepID=UPI00129DD6C8|nr:PX domain-containing protein EREL1 isoform X2 [Nymphaea colorata]
METWLIPSWVQIGIQSPEGVTSVRTILRRFSDFLKLFTTLKRVFPRKNLPSPPPKHAFLRVNSSRVQLEERRSALEEWMGKLLSDIDLSRSVPVASFLDLEAAARSFFSGSSLVKPQTSSAMLDYGSDNTYEASDLGTPRQIAHNGSEAGAEDPLSDQDLTVPAGALAKLGILNHENGLLLGDSTADQQEEMQNQLGKELNATNRSSSYVDSQNNVPYFSDRMDLLLEREERTGHTRKLSSESITSDVSSVRGSEISNIGSSYLAGDGALELGGGAGGPSTSGSSFTNEFQLGDVQIVLPLDQRQKLNRVLITLQRRLTSAKTDMEDMIARLNQEAAVKEYLTTKVKDLNVELETTRQKSKENLQQAILVERERITQLQWDMEELRRQSLEMEAKLRSEQAEKNRAEATKKAATSERELLQHELDSTREQLQNLQKAHEEQEMKMKADVKVLVKEVKSLRKSQTELKQELQQSLKAKSELERILYKEQQRREHSSTSRVKLLHECEVLCNRLQECSVNFLAEEEDKFTVDSSSLSDALDLLATSDNRIGLLLAEAQLLAQENDGSVGAANERQGSESQSSFQVDGDDTAADEAALRKVLADILIDNARLRKLVNSVIRCALKTAPQFEDVDGDEAPTRKTVLYKFLER